MRIAPTSPVREAHAINAAPAETTGPQPAPAPAEGLSAPVAMPPSPPPDFPPLLNPAPRSIQPAPLLTAATKDGLAERAPASPIPINEAATPSLPSPSPAIALAQNPVAAVVPYAASASLSVAAKEIGTGKGIERNWQTDYGSFDKDAYRTKGLEVEVRNISSKVSGECQVTVCWAGKALAGARSVFIHHAETLPASVTASNYTRLRFWSPLVASNVTNYNALGERYAEGSRLDGWFVVVSRGEEFINGVGSNPGYQKLIQNRGELRSLLDAYKPSGRSATAQMPRWRVDSARTEWRARNSTPIPTRYLGQ